MKLLYREVQQFRQTWIWILLTVIVGFVWHVFIQQIIFGNPFGNNPAPDAVLWIIWILFGIGMPLFMHSMKLTVEVRTKGIMIRFFPLNSKFVPFEGIETYEARKYNPILDYGGWGMRWGREGTAYNVSGNRGVQLELNNGKHIMIGSQNPERLVEMIRKAMKNN